jgi:hypothetical protein
MMAPSFASLDSALLSWYVDHIELQSCLQAVVQINRTLRYHANLSQAASHVAID